MKNKAILLSLMLALGAPPASAGPVEDILNRYRQAGAGEFDAVHAKTMWQQTFGPEKRACANCHGADLRVAGKHVNTGKPIAPLSPAVNPDSLQDPEKIEKWFLRNCKWTLGRECTAQEKGDFLTFFKE